MKTYALAGNIIGRKPQNGGNGGGYREEVAYTMDTIGNFGIAQVEDDMNTFEHHPQDSRVKPTEVAPTCGVFGNSIEGKDCLVQQESIVASFMGGQGAKAGGIGYEENVSSTIKAAPSGGNQVPDIVIGQNSFVDTGHGDYWKKDDAAGTIRSEGESRPSRPSNVICVHGSQDPISNTEHANAVNRNNGLENCVLQQNATLCRATQQANAETFANLSPTITEAAGTSGNNQPIICQSGEVAGTLTERYDSSPCSDRGQNVLVQYNGNHKQENKEENNYGNAKETRPIEILRILRDAIGEKAFREWAIGRLGSVQSSEVLQSELHGDGVRCEADKNIGDFYMPLPCEKDCPAWSLRDMRSGICNGCPSQGQGFHEQRAEQPDEGLQELPQQAAPSKESVCDMWKTAEGAWLLRQALAEIQKTWKSIHGQRQNCYRRSVRRLMPIECERLQGMPDNWTRISWRGKPADECPDAPRYKACGNSMGVNCMRWIGLGIEMVENRYKEQQ